MGIGMISLAELVQFVLPGIHRNYIAEIQQKGLPVPEAHAVVPETNSLRRRHDKSRLAAHGRQLRRIRRVHCQGLFVGNDPAKRSSPAPRCWTARKKSFFTNRKSKEVRSGSISALPLTRPSRATAATSKAAGSACQSNGWPRCPGIATHLLEQLGRISRLRIQTAHAKPDVVGAFDHHPMPPIVDVRLEAVQGALEWARGIRSRDSGRTSELARAEAASVTGRGCRGPGALGAPRTLESERRVGMRVSGSSRGRGSPRARGPTGLGGEGEEG